MENYSSVCEAREQFRKAAALALNRHFGSTDCPSWAMDYLNRLLLPEECDGLEMMASGLTWLPEEREALLQFCNYARMAWNLEIAQLATECQERSVANG